MKRVGIALGLALAGILIFISNRHAPHASPLRMPAADRTLVVSSEADAGPGSLRDAILAADRDPLRSRIVLNVKRIAIESALPTLINPQGIVIDGAEDGSVIDASRQAQGSALQIKSPRSVLRRVKILHAHDRALTVMATGVELESLEVSDCHTGITLVSGADGVTIRRSLFERDGTAITGDAPLRNLVISGSTFRENTKAGIWFVGSARPAADDTLSRSNSDVNVSDNSFEKNEVGIVLGNRPAVIQKSRFRNDKASSILVLSGSATIVDNDVREAVGSAISVTGGTAVRISHNMLADNPDVGIMIRDSGAVIENNTLERNGYGIVAITGKGSPDIVIRDNTLSKTAVDAITVIGGSPVLARNQALGSRSAGVRILDLVQSGSQIKTTPQLEANILKGNAIDSPQTGVYKTADTVQP